MTKQLEVGVVCARGLGDALLSMILSHNLSLSGMKVTTFSSILCELKAWFPNHLILPFPQDLTFPNFDRVIVADHACVRESEDSRILILKEMTFDKKKSMVENLQAVCKDRLKLSHHHRENGMTPLGGLTWRAHPKRVIIHPTSTDPKKNWPQKKFLKLAGRLKDCGFEPVFCVSTQERQEWEDAPLFPTVDDLAKFIYESGYMIGNDSGTGHLASLFIPTLSIFARKSYSHLWRPGWGKGEVVTPPEFLPGSRLKQRYWKELLSVDRVLERFALLVKKSACS